MKTAALLALSCAIAASAEGLVGTTDRVLRIQAPAAGVLDETALRRVQEMIGELDVWGETEQGALEVRVPADQAPMFSALGLQVEDATEEHAAHFKWMEENRASQVCLDGAECANQPDFYTRYQERPAILERFNGLSAQFNTVTEKSWGTSTEGLDMQGAVITGTGGGDNKPVVFYFCGEHAREWIPPMFCTYMAETLASGYASGDQEVTRLMDAVEFHILPIMNPDGYVWSHRPGQNMWRKSRKANAGSSCVGTDLNRNYGYRWNTGGSSSNPCSDVFHGQSPFDNPETNNLKLYAESLGDRLIIQTDVHAYGQMWMHPWGWTRTLSPDHSNQQASGDATAAAIQGVNGLRFATGSIANVIYVASGSSCDWFYGEQGVVYAYAPEVRGTSFQPNANNIIPSNNELWAGMVAQVDYALANPVQATKLE